MTLHDFKEKYCRKDPEGLYRGKWFIKDGDCVKYTDLETDVLLFLNAEKAKWKKELVKMVIGMKVLAQSNFDFAFNTALEAVKEKITSG